MNKNIRILAVNPGSTSTKIALFDNENEVFSETIRHAPEELKTFKEIQDQLDYRRDTVERTMEARGYPLADVDVFVGRGGGLLPLVGGTYQVTALLAEHASRGMSGQHPAQLASQICRQFAERYGKKAYVVNPPDVDEFEDIARVTGLRGVYRESHVHALNQKEIALRFCAARGLKYEDVNLIICHIGGGISITAHKKGRMIDSNDIIKGSGPMTPTRAGDMAYMKIVDMAYSGDYTKKELTDKLNKNGGLMDHFGTADTRQVLSLAESGDKYAALIYDGMIYQNAKYVGAMAVALKGKVDAIILTGGVSNGKYFTDKMTEYIGWIAEVVVMPGEFELEALAAGALRAARGQEPPKLYTGIPVWNGF
ncbi:butyrate kinase [Sporobacter termitidis DSM 10068]|uniref:Probable butyrate kinase n=1 Tax=Sporobacter termitidis DSM 10068 TaxID=1123282 RepID=A0A1M5U7K6_9FIRM|nr:butyrate kinase [Sporobacter termitidis]SHH59032.1 butyrate kinase [Sporobacter termitidis DSM 10068]